MPPSSSPATQLPPSSWLYLAHSRVLGRLAMPQIQSLQLLHKLGGQSQVDTSTMTKTSNATNMWQEIYHDLRDPRCIAERFTQIQPLRPTSDRLIWQIYISPGWKIGSSCPRLGLCLDSACSMSTSSGTPALPSWSIVNHMISSCSWWSPTTSSKLFSVCGCSKRHATSGWLVGTIGFASLWTIQERHRWHVSSGYDLVVLLLKIDWHYRLLVLCDEKEMGTPLQSSCLPSWNHALHFLAGHQVIETNTQVVIISTARSGKVTEKIFYH